MKNKAPLALMEQLVMLLVFALAAALCLQMFALSHRLSENSERLDHAVMAVQNAAETVKLCSGDPGSYPELLGGMGDDRQWQIGFDSEWKPAPLETAQYRILIQPETVSQPLLGSAQITAQTSEGESLFQVVVSWQEEAYE